MPRFPPTMQWRAVSDLRSMLAVLPIVGTLALTWRMGWVPPKYFGFAVIAAYLLQRQIAKGKQCSLVKDLSGKYAVVTGSNTGIGLETAKALAQMKCNVIFCCRNEKKAKAAMALVESAKNSDAKLHFVRLDLADFESCRAAAKEVNTIANGRLDYLINNAGLLTMSAASVPPLPNNKQEYHIGCNHLGVVLFTELVLSSVLAAKGRVVNVASMAHCFVQEDALAKLKSRTPVTAATRLVTDRKFDAIGTDPLAPYGLSKGLNIMYTIHLAQRLKGTGVTVASAHPGTVVTELVRHPVGSFVIRYLVGPLLFKKTKEGAQTTLQCALADDLVDGGFYADCEHRPDCLKPYVQNEEDIGALMQWTRLQIDHPPQ